MQTRSELPEPPAEAMAHSRRVTEAVRERIRAAGGWLDFADYMDMVLHAPGLGYYSAGPTKFGPAGDFVTAPEISALYARCLARACLPWLRAHPDSVVVELGAGTGALAAGLLTSFARHGLPAVPYLVLEPSADLRERQRDTLARLAAGHLAAVRWLDALPDAPVQGIVLANEVADSLPVSRFVMRDGGVLADGVVESGESLSWASGDPSPALRAAATRIDQLASGTLPDGYRSEVSLRLAGWVNAVAAALGHGLFLLCDYGMSRREYYRPERRHGTLMCHYRHRAHDDPFLYPGLQDISAWVDFTAVAEAAEAAGLAVAGYGTQAHFLIDAGLDVELAAMRSSDADADLRTLQQARRLVLPGEMGERFKIMALTRGEAQIAGFGFRDLRHTL